MTPTPHLSAQQKPAFSEMRIPLFVHLALIAGAYFASVRLGLLFVVQPEWIASIWPPSGVALAALLLSNRRKWISILLVILIVNVAGNLTGGNTLVVSLGFGLVNTFEAGLSAIVITRILGYSISFSRAFEVVVFFGVVGVCNAFTALFGAAVPAFAFAAPYFDTWVVWWISDTLGMILITPFILIMATYPSLISTMRSYKAYLERIVLLAVIVLVTWYLSSGTSHSLFNFYLIFPLLMWSAFRFGPRGTVSSLMLFGFVAFGMIVYANSGLEITRVSVKESILSMQILVSIAALSSLTLAAVLREQKQTRQRLGLLAEMVDIAPNSILVHDLDGRILYANQRSFDMHGYDEQGFMALNLHDIDIPESEQLIATRMKQIAEKGEANFEAAHYRKDGAIIPLLAHVKQTQWAGLPALLSISSDITERKTAEEKFNQQSIQRQRLLEMGRQLTSSLDIDSVLKDISAEVRNLLGASGVTIYMLDEQGNKLIPVLSYYPLYEDQVMSAKLDIDNCLTGKVIKAKQGMIFNYADQQPEEYHIPGTAIDEEHLIIAPFIINEKAIGSLNIYRSSATFNEDDLALAETFTLYASTAINNARTHQELLDQIAERKQAVEALRVSEEKYRTLVEESSDFIFLVDNKGIILSVNLAGAESLGKKPQEIMGKNVSELFLKEIADRYLQNINRAFISGESKTYESIMRPENQEIWLSTAINPVKDSTGKVTMVFGASRNITERKQMEKALQESEEKFRHFVETSADLVIRLSKTGIIEYISPRIVDLYGYQLDELIGKHLKTTTPIKEIPKAIKALSLVVSGKQLKNFEINQKTKAGRIIPMEINAAPVYQRGKIVGLQGIMRDVTERKQAEAELAQSERDYRGLFDMAHDAIILFEEKDEIVLEANQRACDLYGYSREEFIGMSLVNISTDIDLGKKRVKELFEKGYIKQFEAIQKRKDGTSLYVEVNASRTIYQGKSVILSLNHDITERKTAEEALRESEEKYRLLFENINDAVAITQKGKYIYFNQQFCQMLGYTAAEMDHKDYREVFSEEGLKILAARQQVRERGEEPPAHYETIFVRKDGQLINIAVSVRTIDYEGQSAAYAVLRDITERKQAETGIAESLLVAERANQVKDQFIANISHEIRTPLNSIIGFSDLFQQRYGKMVSENDQGIFQFITNSSDRLMRTVDSILNISQLNAGLIKIQQHKLDLNYIVRTVIGEIKPLADEKGLDLTYSPTNQYAMVSVDNYSIHQAILNITGNAIKYTNEGKIELSLIQKGDRFRLSIQDTGIGISEEYQKRIFDPYTQESEGFTKNFQGIGLGLALSKRYLELNDIELELESQKNVGTTFTLIFPKYDGNDHV